MIFVVFLWNLRARAPGRLATSMKVRSATTIDGRRRAKVSEARHGRRRARKGGERPRGGRPGLHALGVHRGLEDVAERVPARRPPAAPRKSESLFAVVEVPAADHAAGGPRGATAPRGVTPPPGGGRARSRSWGTFFF